MTATGGNGMHGSFRLFGVALFVGCGSQVVIDGANPSETAAAGTTTTTSTSTSAATSTSTSTSTSAATTATSTGAGGGAASLNGNFMQQQIGDCINGEIWLGFAAAPAFTHTLVDRNFCGPHGVKAQPGSYLPEPGEIGFKWTGDAGLEKQTHGYAVVEPVPSVPADPLPPGYAYGPRAVNLMAYTLHDGPVAYHRLEWRGTSTKMADYIQTATIDLVFDAPIAAPAAPKPCTMTVTMQVSVSGAMQPDAKGSETWKLPCKVRPPDKTSFATITADGFENSQYDGSWGAFLDKQGVAKKYAPDVAGLFDDEFRPVLAFVPSEPAHLFHDVYFAWYYEMKNPPPAQVP